MDEKKIKRKKMAKKDPPGSELDTEDREFKKKLEGAFKGNETKIWNSSVESTEKVAIPTVRDYELVEKRSQNSEEKSQTEKENYSKNSARGKRRDFPDEFYVAHPRSVKQTAEHFQDIHSRKLAELLEAFHLFDFDRDGFINHADLKKTFASLNRVDVDDEEIHQMLLEGLKPLNFDAFVILLGYKTLDLDPEEVLVDAFSNWDYGRDGLISYERLLHDIMAWGDKFTEEEALAALADAPVVLTRAKEKMIDYVQFCEDLCGLRKMMQRKPTAIVEN